LSFIREEKKMLKFLRKIRKGFKTACLTAALTTCWNVGQTAKADWAEVTFKVTGTVSITEKNVSNLYLLYGLNNSYVREFALLNLGNFSAGVAKDFSVNMAVLYDEAFFDSDDRNMYWQGVGLYGDISSGTYTEGINGVTLGINAAVGDSWSTYCGYSEGYIFSQLLNNAPGFLKGDSYFYPWYSSGEFQGQDINLTIDLYDFSDASYNGQIQFNAEVIPEPVSIVLFGTGGMIVVALRRRNQ
jgi:hypothetical protein